MSLPALMTFIPLPHSYVDKSSKYADIIAPAVLAYAAGDAFGVQFEFLGQAHTPIVHRLEKKEGWPLGGVSDDTLLSLITIDSLEVSDPKAAAAKFLIDLRAAVPNLRGLGPTTRTALGMEVKSDERGAIGNTNGAMMRTALTGLAFSPLQSDLRRAWVRESALATHSHPDAVTCAIVLSCLFSAATSPGVLKLSGIGEYAQQEAQELPGASAVIRSALSTADSWIPPESGISLDPLETLLAVLWSVRGASNCKDVFSRACWLGGDTDTVAALSGGLFCAINSSDHQFFDIDWLPMVQWSEILRVRDSMELLIAKRGSADE